MGQHDAEKNQERRDLFISYTSSDRQWAEWIAMQLEQEGYTLFLEAWDFRPGANLVLAMDNAAKQAERTLLVLSPAYLQAGFAQAQWATAFSDDPTGVYARLLPVRIEPCIVEGLLRQIVGLDLVDLDEAQAREQLLTGVLKGRAKPERVVYPGQAISGIAFPGSLPPIWNVPFARNPFFTGRDDLLERLHTQLYTTQAAALSQPQAINGLGGIGKTQLALEYSYRYRSEYQTVFWARADTTEALNASYTEIARLLQLPQQDAQEQEVIVQAVKGWLRTHQSWLLILDNADELALIQPFLPTACPGHLLLTTRAQTMGKLAQRLEVETLETETGSLLLLRRAGLIPSDASLETASPSDRAIANDLTKELGGLPLALDQAGAYVEVTQCSLADYQQQYQTRRTDLLALRSGPTALPGRLIDDHPDPVATTWSLSFAKVEAANLMAAEVLRICAFLAPDAIPEELLAEALKTPLPTSETPKKPKGPGGWFSPSTPEDEELPMSTHQVVQPWEIDEAVAILLAYSLIQRNTLAKAVRVHRLVQAVVRDAIEEQKKVTWITCVIGAVNTLFPEVNFGTWKQCARYMPQAQVCATWITQLDLLQLEGASLLGRAGWYLYDRGQYGEAELLYRRAMIIFERQLGTDHPSTTSSMNNLAVLYKNQGKHTQAELLYKQALAIDIKTYGAEHLGVATDLNNLASLYHTQGKYTEAEPLYQRALAICEQKLGVSHPSIASCLNNLAELYRAQGKYSEAKLLLKRALAIYEQELESGHPSIAMSLNNLASLHHAQGEHTEAELLYQRALVICEQELGASHPSTAMSLNNLASLYHAQGKYAEAEPLYQRTLEIWEQGLGPMHPSTASGLNNLAQLYYKQGQYAKAEPLYQRALAIYEQELGAIHPSTASCLNNLAQFYCNQGEYTKAELLLKRALAICEQELGANHPSTALCLNNSAELYRTQGEYTKAELLIKRALAICEQELGPMHPSTANCLNNLAEIYYNQRKYTEAEPLYKRALTICEQELGGMHSSTASCLNNLAQLYSSQGKYMEAETLYQQALAIWEKILSRNHPSTQIVRANYLILLRRMGRNAEAEQLEIEP